MTDLLPCPFCGGGVTITEISHQFEPSLYSIVCPDCKGGLHRWPRTHVITAWNRRASDARHAKDQAEIDALRQQLESRTKPWSGDIPNDMLDWCRLHEIDVHPWRRAFHAKLQDLVEMRDKQADARHAADAEAPEVIRRHEYGPTAAQQPPLRGEDGKEPQT